MTVYFTPLPTSPPVGACGLLRQAKNARAGSSSFSMDGLAALTPRGDRDSGRVVRAEPTRPEHGVAEGGAATPGKGCQPTPASLCNVCQTLWQYLPAAGVCERDVQDERLSCAVGVRPGFRPESRVLKDEMCATACAAPLSAGWVRWVDSQKIA